jgi:hypothetical protein
MMLSEKNTAARPACLFWRLLSHKNIVVCCPTRTEDGSVIVSYRALPRSKPPNQASGIASAETKPAEPGPWT